MIKILLTLSVFLAGEIHAQQNYNKLNVKELDVTSRVNVTSTTKSSKPCPAMTETQRNAIATPLNGSCIYNTTTSKLNVYNGTIWKAAGGGVDNWLTATAYSVDDIVIESSKIYQCLTTHTSGTFATDLAALKWAEISSTIPVNLTGPITSVGNATSIASQTGTGSTFVVQNTPTLTTPNIGAATGTSLTLAGNISAYNYDKDNMLVNGNFENPLSTEWTCTVGTCTRTTTAGEFSKDTAALKVVLSTQSMNVSQTVITPSGIQKQGLVRVIYRVPATMADAEICSLVDSTEQACAKNANLPGGKLIFDDTFRSIEIPLTFGTTSAGIKFKTTSSYTANAYFDGAILAQGLGLQNLQLDNVYSAKSTSGGTISDENKDWINGNASVASAKYTITFNTGIFTVAPNCWATVNNTPGSQRIIAASSVSATQVVFSTFNAASAAGLDFMLSCQKSGNDYLAASSNVYSQASANTDWASCGHTTSDFAGFGTVASIETQCKRDGSDLLMRGKFTSGVSTATEARINLKLSGAALTSSSVSLIPSLQMAGGFQFGDVSSGAASVGVSGTVLIEPSVGYITFSARNSAYSGLTKREGDDIFNNGSSYSINARIPIAGWSNANVIVGSFEGMYQSKNIIYKNSTAQSIPNTTSTIVNFGTVENDTTGFVTTGASWKFQPNVAGFYRVSSAIQFASNNYGSSVIFESNLYKNGSVLGGMGYFQNSATGVNVTPNLTGSRSVYLNGSSDYVDIRVYQTSGGSQPLTASAQYNHISISREGI